MRRLTILIPVVLVALVILLSSIFIVDERERVLVLQFGQIEQVRDEPGLGFKIPLIQEVVRYDDRILALDTNPIEVTPSDDRRLVVDAFARYRIADVRRFRQATGASGATAVRAAEQRLDGILETALRGVLGSEGVTSNTILSEDRSRLMQAITEQARAEADAFGLFILDVRLKQTNLPAQNLAATFARMEAEREREAADEIARGEEAAQRVRALADRTRVELVSEAQREAEITRGEADAERNSIFAGAFGANPEFFEFYRSLTAYERALLEGNSTLVLNPNSEFFEYLRGSGESALPGIDVVPAAAAPDEAQGAGGRAARARANRARRADRRRGDRARADRGRPHRGRARHPSPRRHRARGRPAGRPRRARGDPDARARARPVRGRRDGLHHRRPVGPPTSTAPARGPPAHARRPRPSRLGDAARGARPLPRRPRAWTYPTVRGDRPPAPTPVSTRRKTP